MTNKYLQPGHVMDYVNDTGSAIASGAVVRMGNTLGVALVAIAIGATGTVGLDGVYTLPKVSGASVKQGESLIWHAASSAFDVNTAALATGDISGPAAMAFESLGAGTTTLKVKLSGVPGTRTP